NIRRGEELRLMRGRRRALRRGRLRYLGRRGVRGRGVPAAGGGRDVDGIVGLRLGGEGLDRELGRGERLGIEALGDIVALLRGVRVALGCREAEPLEGFGEVLLDADAAGIEDAEVKLAVGDAAVSRLAEPACRALVVRAL